MNIFLPALTFILCFSVWSYLFRSKKHILIILFPIMVQGYTGIIPGLFWLDIATVVWLLLAAFYVRRMGIFSVCFFGAFCFQVISNLYAIDHRQFVSLGEYDFIMTPLHLYMPLIVMYLMIENVKIDLLFFKKKYFILLVSCFVIIVFNRILFAGAEGASLRSVVPIISSIAGFVSIVTPLVLLYSEKEKLFSRNFLLIGLTFATIVLSETRGALANFILLLLLLKFIKITKKELFVGSVILIMVLGLLVSFVEYLPQGFQSIITLYTNLFSGNLNELSNNPLIKSGDRVRFIIWHHALDVWTDNVWLGAGTNQFLRNDIAEGLPIDKVLSPHHAFLSKAVSGGICTAAFHFLPILFLMIRNLRKGKTAEDRYIASAAALNLVSSMVLGYSFFFAIVLIFYLNQNTMRSEPNG